MRARVSEHVSDGRWRGEGGRERDERIGESVGDVWSSVVTGERKRGREGRRAQKATD